MRVKLSGIQPVRQKMSRTRDYSFSIIRNRMSAKVQWLVHDMILEKCSWQMIPIRRSIVLTEHVSH